MSDQRPCYEIGRFSINCNAQGTHKCRHNTTNAAPGPAKPQGAPVAMSATNATDHLKVDSDAATSMTKEKMVHLHVKNLSAMSTTINLQEYREIQQREREHEPEEAFNKSHARKKSRSNAQLLSSPQPTTMYTAEDQLRRTKIAPHISASTLSTAASTATSATAIVTTSGPASSSLSTATSQQKPAQHQQILTQMQQHQHFLAQQQLLTQQQQTSPTSPTPIYTIDAFITRYAHKLQSLDHSIKGKVLTAETLKSDPLQDQRRRELFLSISSYEAKLVEYEDKIEKLFRLKICNGK
ncbi:hypothetical protein BKA57DRAFT_441451 [Linnemannia elongata]|nr:hypothetical protein BKA57DRAFT_441451 [Linnemannia elongata]